jgi:tRNA/tmRNA/rRNA uracil-C5-methylase (TrmA/RlmC/RlmD family)
METVTIEKLVFGGQGLATMEDGRKVFVWNALTGETVQIRIINFAVANDDL